MSFMFFFPDVVITDALPLTGGLAAACLFGVLLVKLMGDPDHTVRDFRIAISLLGLGAIFYFVPYVLGVQFNHSFLVTNSNQGWAVALAYVSIALLALMGAIAAWYALRTGGRAEVQEPASGQ
jgi:protein-S-isoprenylcysteine O-methyltransferase Ste14